MVFYTMRRVLTGFCWFWAGMAILLGCWAVLFRQDISHDSRLSDWRDITKVVSRDIFVAACFLICALLLRRCGKRKGENGTEKAT